MNYAKIENNKVVDIIVADQDHIDTLSGQWINLEKFPYAKIGSNYDKKLNAIYCDQPFPSWKLDKTTWLWEPPTPYPDPMKHFRWNEDKADWDELD